MNERKISAILVSARTCRLIGVLAVGLMLAGCDKCNDWRIFNQAAGPQLCKGMAPVQQ
jgi:hypothetical protein